MSDDDKHDDKLDDLLLRWEALAEEGRDVAAEELCEDCPDLVEPLRHRITALKAMNWMRRSADLEESVQAGTGQPDRPRLLAGRYRLDRLVGQGGYAQVWLGYDLELQRPVAVKVPKPSRRFSSEEIERFLIEARKVAALRHPGIVAVHDVVKVEGAYVIVADWIDGCDLGERLRQGKLPPDEAARIIAGVARSLDYAHRQGIIHQDIKPANILLDAQDKPLLCDFGIAADQALPTAQDRGGTLPYMAPEQTQAQPLDVRSDIWSLGVVLYEALAGQFPFDADDPGALREKIINDAPTPPRTISGAIPSPLDRVCLKCLAKRPQDRYPTAAALADDLEEYLRPSPGRRHRVILFVSVLVLFAVAVGAYLLGGALHPKNERAGIPEEPKGEPAVSHAHAQVRCMTFSPDGSLLATGGADGKVRIWKLAADLVEVAVLDQIAPVRSMIFSSTGKTLVVGCDNGTARFWDVSAAKPKEGLVVPGHFGPVTCLALSADEKIFVTGGADGTTRVYLDPSPETQAAVIPKATESVVSVTLNSAADKLLVGLGNGPKPAELYLWHIVPEKKRPRLNNGGRAVLGTVDDVQAITASPDHSIILAATPKKIVVWSQMRVVGTFEWHSGTIISVALAPDHRHAVSADNEGNVIYWGVKEMRVVQRRKEAPVQAVAVSPNGDLVAVGADGSVRLWRLPRPSS